MPFKEFGGLLIEPNPMGMFMRILDEKKSELGGVMFAPTFVLIRDYQKPPDELKEEVEWDDEDIDEIPF